MSRLSFGVGTPRWMAPEMMSTQVKIGPSVDVYSFGVVMWEVWSGRKPWSELSDKMDIFKAVRDEKKTLRLPENEDIPDGYGDLMKRCCKYKANQRPLIDVVRVELQNLMENAARVDLRTMRRSCMPSSTPAGTSIEIFFFFFLIPEPEQEEQGVSIT